MRRPKYLISWIIIGLTFPLLVLMTVNQFNWLQELQQRDRDRIMRGMITVVDKFSLKLQEEILYPAMITRMKPTRQSEIDALFAERFLFWKNFAPNSALVRDVYLVEGLSGATRHWVNGQFVPAEANSPIEAWVKLLREGPLPERVQETDADIYLSEPAFNFGNEPYFFIYDLDKPYIMDSLIPSVAKSSLDETDLFAYRIIDSRNGRTLYASLSSYQESTFEDPDLEEPVITHDGDDGVPQEGPFERTPQRLSGESTQDSETGRNDPVDARGEFSDEDQRIERLPSGVSQNDRVEGSDRQMQNRPLFLAMKRDISGDFLASIRIQVVNRDGSLAELTSRATFQNALISLGILAILLLGMIMLAEASRRARDLAKSQQEFIATITHELKTPLAVISSAAENLGDGLVRDQAKTRQYGEMIKKEASRLAISVEHFLLYSNTNTIMRMKPVLCEVSELVQAALRFTEEDRVKCGIRTEVILPEEPVYILGDRIALESALQNLAQNVIRHAAEGKYLGLLVSVDKKQTKNGSVIIKVRDKGPGISPWEQKTIFEPFVRGKRAVDKQIPGNGIGLNLVKRIVTVHGGTIALESKLDMGSAFTITFPENRGDTDVYPNSDDRG